MEEHEKAAGRAAGRAGDQAERDHCIDGGVRRYQKALEQIYAASRKRPAKEIAAEIDRLIAESDVVPSNGASSGPVNSKKISSPIGRP